MGEESSTSSARCLGPLLKNRSYELSNGPALHRIACLRTMHIELPKMIVNHVAGDIAIVKPRRSFELRVHLSWPVSQTDACGRCLVTGSLTNDDLVGIAPEFKRFANCRFFYEPSYPCISRTKRREDEMPGPRLVPPIPARVPWTPVQLTALGGGALKFYSHQRFIPSVPQSNFHSLTVTVDSRYRQPCHHPRPEGTSPCLSSAASWRHSCCSP
jgi:hypothetical protein